MAQAYFRIEKGLNINDNVYVIEGSGAPSGDALTSLVGKSSFWLDRTNGKIYFKISTAGGDLTDWAETASKAYVDSQTGGSISWREPVEVHDSSSTSVPASATNTVDGVTIYAGMRVLFSALTLSTNRNVWIASGSTGNWTWTEDTNSETSGDTVYVVSGTHAGKRYTYNGTAWVLTDITTQDELGYIRTFIGKASGNDSPSYSSITQVSQSSSLETAIGALDASIGTDPSNGEVILAANAVNANITALDNHIALNNHKTITSNITTITTVDTIAKATVDSVKWVVFATDNATTTKKRACEILAVHDGTNIDYTEYAVLKLGNAITGFSITATISGANILLQVTSTEAVNVEVRRVITV